MAKAKALGLDLPLDVIPDGDHYEFLDPTSTTWPHVLAATTGITAITDLTDLTAVG